MKINNLILSLRDKKSFQGFSIIKNGVLINILLTLLLAFSVTYLVSSIIYYKYSDIPVKPPENIDIGIQGNKSAKIDRTLIITKNIFKLDTAQAAASTDAKGDNSGVISQGEATDFKGVLVGVLKGKYRSLALIRMEQDVFILGKGESEKGLKVEDIGVNNATIVYQGKKYNLKLEGSDKGNEIAGKSRSEETANQSDDTGTIKATISRKEVEENMSNVNNLIRTMYISPYYVGGEFVGYRIARMRLDAILRKAGVENGDVLVRMNGERIDTPEKMFELFTRWKDASAVTMDIIRGDQKRSILVEIR